MDGAVCAAARAAAYAVRRMPGGVPDGLRYRFGGWFDASPAACQAACVYRFSGWFGFETGPAASLMARSYRFGSRRARRLARIASADGSDRGGPAYCPTARSALRQMVRDGPGVLPDGSLAALRRVIRGDGSLDNCLTGKIR